MVSILTTPKQVISTAVPSKRKGGRSWSGHIDGVDFLNSGEVDGFYAVSTEARIPAGHYTLVHTVDSIYNYVDRVYDPEGNYYFDPQNPNYDDDRAYVVFIGSSKSQAPYSKVFDEVGLLRGLPLPYKWQSGGDRTMGGRGRWGEDFPKLSYRALGKRITATCAFALPEDLFLVFGYFDHYNLLKDDPYGDESRSRSLSYSWTLMESKLEGIRYAFPF